MPPRIRRRTPLLILLAACAALWTFAYFAFVRVDPGLEWARQWHAPDSNIPDDFLVVLFPKADCWVHDPTTHAPIARLERATRNHLSELAHPHIMVNGFVPDAYVPTDTLTLNPPPETESAMIRAAESRLKPLFGSYALRLERNNPDDPTVVTAVELQYRTIVKYTYRITGDQSAVPISMLQSYGNVADYEGHLGVVVQTIFLAIWIFGLITLAAVAILIRRGERRRSTHAL